MPAARRVPRVPRLLREPMWVLGLVVLVDEIDKNIVRGLIDPLKDEFGVGDFAIGVLLSLQLLFNGVITVPAGYLADRWNRTRAIGTTVIAWSAMTAAGAGAWSFVVLVGLRSILGFGQAVSEPSAASLLGDNYPPEKRGKAFSIHMAMLAAVLPAFGIQLLGLFVDSMAIPGLRAGLTNALPAHLRGTGFGAFNLVAVVAGQAAAPLVVSAVSSLYGENLRVALLVVSPLSFVGAAVLLRARKFLDDDMQQIMLAVLTALQEERDRQAAEFAETRGPAPEPQAPAPG